MPGPINLLDPDVLHAIQHMALRARMAVEGSRAGIHTSRRHGSSTEFAEYRPYTPGDDIRRLDWKVFARTDKYHVKKYHDETNLRCFFLLDCSGSMGYRPWGDPERPTKLVFSCIVAAALAHLLIDQQDAVGLATMSGKADCFLPPRSAISHLQKMAQSMGGLETGGESPLEEFLLSMSEKVPDRSLIILFSDLFCDIEKTETVMKQIKQANHDMVLFHTLDPDELEFPFSELTQLDDMEDSRKVLADPNVMKEEYRAEAAAFCESVKESCRVNGIDYVPASTGEPPEEALKRLFMLRMDVV